MSKFNEKDFENLVRKTIINEAESLKVMQKDVQLILYLHNGSTPQINVLHNYKHNGRTVSAKDLLGWKGFFVDEQKITEGVKQALLKGATDNNILPENINVMFLKNPNADGQYIIWLFDAKKAVKQMTFKELLN
jgi:hypothetical protein